MNTVLGTWTLAHRELLRFYRQRSRIVGSLAMPVIVWALLGTGLQAAFPSNVGSEAREFLKYFFPGNLILTILFTSIFSTISVIEDRNEGFLQGVMVSPLSSLGLILGKVIGGSFIASFQGLIFLLLAPLAGFQLSFSDWVYLSVVIFSVSFAMTSLGFLFAWKLDSVQGFHAIMNLVLFPMWLLSGAFFPAQSASLFLKPLILINPLTYGMNALKGALGLAAPVGAIGGQIGVVWLFGIFFVGSSLLLVNKKREVTV